MTEVLKTKCQFCGNGFVIKESNGRFGFFCRGPLCPTRTTYSSFDEAHATINSHAPDPNLVLLPKSLAEEIGDLKRNIDEQVKEEKSGRWHTCSGCFEIQDGYPAPAQGYYQSSIFGCYIGSGCSECGGLGVRWDDLDVTELALSKITEAQVK